MHYKQGKEPRAKVLYAAELKICNKNICTKVFIQSDVREHQEE